MRLSHPSFSTHLPHVGCLLHLQSILLGTSSQSLWGGLEGSKTQRGGARWPEEQRSQNATGTQDSVLSGFRTGLFLFPSILRPRQKERRGKKQDMNTQCSYKTTLVVESKSKEQSRATLSWECTVAWVGCLWEDRVNLKLPRKTPI